MYKVINCEKPGCGSPMTLRVHLGVRKMAHDPRTAAAQGGPISCRTGSGQPESIEETDYGAPVLA